LDQRLLRGPLDGGVDSESDDEEDEPVKHAENRSPAVFRLLLWAHGAVVAEPLAHWLDDLRPGAVLEGEEEENR